jgi:hypothetical protein
MILCNSCRWKHNKHIEHTKHGRPSAKASIAGRPAMVARASAAGHLDGMSIPVVQAAVDRCKLHRGLLGARSIVTTVAIAH